MDAFVLQEWCTIRGSANVTQSEEGWLDLSPYEDVQFWLLVSEVSGSPTPQIIYQTSPTKDEAMFGAQSNGMTGTAITLAASSSPVVTPVLAWSAPFPLARWVRWQILASASFDVTMRILVTAVAPRL